MEERSAIELIKQRLDIVGVIGETVQLKRSGRGYKGLCPFHDEKTPSFHVHPESQHFKCFGCGKGGDLFTFVMERDKLGFGEALRELAERTNVELPRRSEGDVSAARQRKDLQGALGQVQAFYVEMLRAPEAEVARRYLEKRGLAAAIARFGLGFAPGPRAAGGARDGTVWPLSDHFQRNRMPVEAGLAVGLLKRSQQGHLYDFLRNRVTFPIHDEAGRIVAFGGRILPGFEGEHEPKYLNTSESEVFAKGRILYGLWQARASKAKQLVVMEGYTDVIAAQMAGVDGAVATLGTSFTAAHAALVRRFAPDGVVLLFDGDDAGYKAAERAFRSLAGEQVEARVCLLEGGLDPADLVQKSGAAALTDLVARGEDALAAYVRLLGRRLDLGSHRGRTEAIGECADILAGIQEATRRLDLLDRMASKLMLEPDRLQGAVEERRARSRARSPAVVGQPAAKPPAESRAADALAGETILAALLREPPLLSELEERLQGLDGVARSLAEGITGALLDTLRRHYLEQGAWPASGDLLRAWWSVATSDPLATQSLVRVEVLAGSLESAQRALLDGVSFLQRQLKRQNLARLREEYRRAVESKDQARARQLEQELVLQVRAAPPAAPPRSL